MPVTLPRRAGRRQVEGLRTGSLDALVARFSSAAPPDRWLVSDLSLGGWRSHQIALELFTQLDLPPPYTADGTSPTARAWQAYLDAATRVGRYGVAAGPASSNAAPPGGTHGYADSAGEWVDTEAMGNPTIRSALQLAGQLIERLRQEPPTVVLIFTPRFGLAWESENAWLTRFLIDGLHGSPHRLHLVSTPDDETSSLPADWQVNWTHLPSCAAPTEAPVAGLLPGLLDPGTAERFTGATGDAASAMPTLRAGRRLVPPAWRRSPRRTSRFAYDRLAADLRDATWLRAYALYHGNNMHVDPLLLSAEAIRHVEAGGYDLALRLIGRAIDCTRHPEQKGLLQLMAQGWRIAMHRFEEAAKLSDPPPSVSAQTRGALLHTKGWAFAMRGDAASGDDHLTRAREVLEALYADRREFLYLLNIHALAKVRLGRLDDAMDLERRIERAIALQDPPDPRLVYINAINLARLHRRGGDLDGAEAYYRRAFDTTLGLRSESDAIYGNVCLARLDEAREKFRDALDGWIRAALHWASATVPEAVGWRVRSAIVARDRAHHTDTEDVSAAMADMLVKLADGAGVARALGDDARRPAPACVRVDPDGAAPGTAAPIRALGCTTCCAMALETPVAPAVDGPAYRRLCGILRDLLEVLTGCSPLDEPTLLIDDQFGCEMPRTPAEMHSMCVRHGVETITWQGQVTRLSPQERAALEAASRVRIADGVTTLILDDATPQVHFKRYRRPYRLSDEDVHLLRGITDAPRGIADLAASACPGGDPQAIIPRLRLLERQRVVTIRQT